MTTIRLFCAAGFSTGMLVEKIKEAAAKREIEIDIAACPQNKLEDNIGGADVALLGPQVAYTLEKSRGVCESKGVAIGVIPMADYGMMDGNKVLDFALKLIEELKNKG